jgi:hypothetical protein
MYYPITIYVKKLSVYADRTEDVLVLTLDVGKQSRVLFGPKLLSGSTGSLLLLRSTGHPIFLFYYSN